MVNPLNKRQIRSFVRREGRLTRGQQHALDTLWSCYGVELSEAPVDLDTAFGRRAPCVLEIGFGNGETMVRTATGRPDLNFLGIEVHRPGIGHLLRLVSEQRLSNVRIICEDAVSVVRDHLPESAFQQVSIFFPDPWPKKRHHKRRLIQHDFIPRLVRILDNNGLLHIATDWANYAEHIALVMQRQPAFEPAAVDTALPRPLTKFEQRGLDKGHAVRDLVYRKTA